MPIAIDSGRIRTSTAPLTPWSAASDPSSQSTRPSAARRARPRSRRETAPPSAMPDATDLLRGPGLLDPALAHDGDRLAMLSASA
jgi:hypothetical protein